jgi:hypothetical protein
MPLVDKEALFVHKKKQEDKEHRKTFIGKEESSLE